VRPPSGPFAATCSAETVSKNSRNCTRFAKKYAQIAAPFQQLTRPSRYQSEKRGDRVVLKVKIESFSKCGVQQNQRDSRVVFKVAPQVLQWRFQSCAFDSTFASLPVSSRPSALHLLGFRIGLHTRRASLHGELAVFARIRDRKNSIHMRA
jgi:hypothetical protein